MSLAHTLHRPAVFAVPPVALCALIGSGADELLLWGQRVLPARLQASGFAFRYSEIEDALRAVLAQK